MSYRASPSTSSAPYPCSLGCIPVVRGRNIPIGGGLMAVATGGSIRDGSTVKCFIVPTKEIGVGKAHRAHLRLDGRNREQPPFAICHGTHVRNRKQLHASLDVIERIAESGHTGSRQWCFG